MQLQIKKLTKTLEGNYEEILLKIINTYNQSEYFIYDVLSVFLVHDLEFEMNFLMNGKCLLSRQYTHFLCIYTK